MAEVTPNIKSGERFKILGVEGLHQLLDFTNGKVICSKVNGNLTREEQERVTKTLSDRQTFTYQQEDYSLVVIPQLLGTEKNAVRFVRH